MITRKDVRLFFSLVLLSINSAALGFYLAFGHHWAHATIIWTVVNIIIIICLDDRSNNQ